MTVEPRFISWDDALVIHEDSLLNYGGRIGLPHPGHLESALDAPRNLYLYECHEDDDRPAIALLAAAYWVHLALAHAFADGNKRVGFSSAVLFLYTNGYELEIDPDEAYDLGIAVAEREIDRGRLAKRLEPSLTALED
ncbi:type II toxin-antitoxin system death-on-curing family toxin [Fimbriimonas ginsengisoli]|uniref:Death on curing protein, Doc toxin n=1 Tax=Fimbriimonas ginsengisoli Gsoil 348 TaxID=661478 RepID=A0A068NNX7_FIMGI|nr:type II toxin-antitoxin system death-on-curing family toxin [Fimbriimonas ginsengisoli]AIE85067.1 Death on curing protein, Doc toxin [Fimbriimonas ginsengisoli Gsoil 348]